MAENPRWRRTELNQIVRADPSSSYRIESTAFNAEVLSSWGVPEASRFSGGQQSTANSALGDANLNMTVWFLTVSLLVEEACRRGLDPAESQFIDVGCGVGLAALYAVEAHGFESAVGIEHDARWVGEARELISSTSASASSKARTSIVHADAASYRLLPSVAESRFIFLFQPFGQQTLGAFMRNNSSVLTSADVVALANDVALLKPLVDSLPRCTWIRNDRTNSSLVFPGGYAEIKKPVSNQKSDRA